MRKYYFIIIAMLCCTLLQSCYKEEDNLFSQSSSQRVTEDVKKYTSLLESSDKGWLLQYYPGGSAKIYGGYNLLIKFSKGKATLSSDVAVSEDIPAWTDVTSLYNVNAEQGAVLSFDTYNPVIHFFTEPISSDMMDGYEGDFEFVIMNATDNDIVLQGKKYKTIMHLTRLPEDFDKATFTKNIEKITESIKYNSFSVSAGGKDYGKVSMSSQNLVGAIGDSTVQAPYVFTEKGIHLYAPLRVGTDSISDLTFDATKQSFTDGNVTLAGIPDPAYEAFKGAYTFKYQTTLTSAPKTFDVSIEEGVYGSSYIMKGFMINGTPMNITIQYANGQMQILAQKLTSLTAGDLYLCPWDIVDGEGNFTWNAQVGLVAEPDPKQPGVYNLVDNGVWGTYITDSFIAAVISGSSYVTDYGRYILPQLIKK